LFGVDERSENAFRRRSENLLQTNSKRDRLIGCHVVTNHAKRILTPREPVDVLATPTPTNASTT
jgi:hypothetical protein